MSLFDDLLGLAGEVKDAGNVLGIPVDFNPTHSPVFQSQTQTAQPSPSPTSSGYQAPPADDNTALLVIAGLGAAYLILRR